ncbi:MAG: DNA/RNA nuclease SfsA [Bacteroidota bacterium]
MLFEFKNNLVHGHLVKRYKRFLADVRLDNGDIITAHCTNSGSMISCIEEGAEVYLTHHDDPMRKTQYTWEMIKIGGNWVGINTSNPNIIAFNAISGSKIRSLKAYTQVRREITVGDSRIDIMAENIFEKCYIEVKNVTYREGRYALFPDAVTSRGTKHLNTLMNLKMEGHRAIMLYVIQRSDVEIFAPAKLIDPVYAQTLHAAYNKGVEILPLMMTVTPLGINLKKELPFELD